MESGRFGDIFKRMLKKRFFIIVFCLWALISISMFFAYRNEWVPAMERPKAIFQGGILKEEENEQLLALSENQDVKQTITMPSNEITGFSIFLNAEDSAMQGNLHVSLQNKESEDTIKSWNYNLGEMKSRGFFCFLFPEAIEVEKGQQYVIVVSVSNIGEVVPNMVVSAVGDAEDAVLEINGEQQDSIIPFQIFNGNHGMLKYFFIALYIGMTALFVWVCFMYIKHIKAEWSFVGLALCMGIIYLFVIPPFVSPDEGLHFLTVYEKSERFLGRSVMNSEGKVVLPSDALWGGDKCQATADTYLQYMEGALGHSESVDEEVVTRAPITESLHPGYFPQIAGVMLAESLSLNYEQLLLLGRLFALFWYCFIMFWAVKLMPYGKTFLTIVGLLPMTMQQVVSYNYDSVLIGISFFLIAYLLNFILKERPIKWFDWLLLGAIAITIASIKLVYLPIFVLAFAIPQYKFGGGKKKVLGGLWISVISIVTIAVTRLATISSYTVEAGEQVAGAVEKMSISYCLHHIKWTIFVIYRTFEREFDHYLSEMIASPLGWLEVDIPNIIILGFIIVILLSVVREQNVKRRIGGAVQINAVFIVLATIALIMVATLNWTPVDSAVIIGIQGRYFLPVLPLALLVLENNALILQKKIDHYLILFAVYLQCMTIYFFTLTAISR